MKLFVSLFMIPLFLIGCATARDSMILGISMGAAAGGGMGNLSTAHSAQGTAIGALIGAGIGAAFGYLGHKEFLLKRQPPHTVSNGTDNPKTPRVTEPRYRSIWVPDKIEGERYIQGHRVFILEDTGKWTID